MVLPTHLQLPKPRALVPSTPNANTLPDMTHIIRDAEFKTAQSQGLWPGMWVHTCGWGIPQSPPSPIDSCFLWRVEQHDGVMLLAGQGEDILLPLTPEIADDCALIENGACELLAAYPAEWAAIRKLGWGVYLHYYSNSYNLHSRLGLHCRRRHSYDYFFLAEQQQYQLDEYPEILRSVLATAWWRLKHPRYAHALATQHPREFWDWPNTPALKQLDALGKAALQTVEGSITIAPDGKLKATGRKAWGFSMDEEPE